MEEQRREKGANEGCSAYVLSLAPHSEARFYFPSSFSSQFMDSVRVWMRK